MEIAFWVFVGGLCLVTFIVAIRNMIAFYNEEKSYDDFINKIIDERMQSTIRR